MISSFGQLSARLRRPISHHLFRLFTPHHCLIPWNCSGPAIPGGWHVVLCGRYGYRRVTALLRAEDWRVNHKRIERLWRREGLKVPHKRPKRRRLCLNDGLCVRLRAAHKDHVWSYDFVMDRTSDGQLFRMLTLMDEHTREYPSIDVSRSLRSEDVLERLSDLFVRRGVPKYLRSDNGSEFTAHKVRDWLKRVGVQTLFIEPGSPWENGYTESFNGKLRDELLERELFDTMLEAKVLIERWRKQYNTVQSHSSLGYQPPAPESIQPQAAHYRSLNTGVTIWGSSQLPLAI